MGVERYLRPGCYDSERPAGGAPTSRPRIARAEGEEERMGKPIVFACPKCRRAVKLRQDGCIPKHRMRVGMGGQRKTDPCPASETAPREWMTEKDRRRQEFANRMARIAAMGQPNDFSVSFTVGEARLVTELLREKGLDRFY